MITAECINCGACDPECPNTAIYQGGVEWLAPDGSMHAALSNDIFYIVPEKCTECVGFYDQEACAKVCPVDCCVPNPEIPEAESLLLARARTLHPEKTIPDDSPSRFTAGGAESPAAAPAAAPTAPAAAPAAAAPVVEGPALSLPPIDEWEVPIQCFRCEGEYTVPFQYFRAGVVFYCPHCQGSLVPNLSMVRAVGDSLEQFHARWTRAFDDLLERRRRELEQFEEHQRRDLERFETELREISSREKAPGAPTKRRGFFAF